ncbi:hypothetical protein COLU111180_12970 [Cohnella lubricantis]|uniref:RNA polymerase subunit sigma n=1 Tax=Cohnella lubricantis TaxID=2163172 RepID=A0A841TKC1_9BACL|nr:hypothetical protein [Cohnella lubricantis]MBB6679387.1 hypothetical protein [Cohnella lubricantis]MBP2117469.1 hypothetical protein [Cohnella lubricantis]
MSYRPIDLQTSLPRTLEMSPLQQQQQQRSAMEQAALGHQAAKQAEKQAQSSVRLESAGKRSISEKEPRERKKHSSAAGKNGGGESEPGEDEQSAHPYKGRHLDIKL